MHAPLRYFTISFVLLVTFTACKNKVDEAYELKALGLRDKAIEALNKITSEDPKNADAYFALGNMYAESGQGKDAMKNYEDALKISPNNLRFKTHRLLLSLFWESQRPNLAAELKALLDKNRSESLPLFLMTIYYSLAHDPTTIKAFFETVNNLHKLKPLSDWQILYADKDKKAILAHAGMVLGSSFQYCDDAGKQSGELHKGDRFTVTRVTNDTVYFTDPFNYALESRKAWRVIQMLRRQTFRQSEAQLTPITGLFDRPTCPQYVPGYGQLTIVGSYNDYHVLANQVPQYNIEEESITPTGNTLVYPNFNSQYRDYGVEYPEGKLKFTWEEVEYQIRSPLSRMAILSDDILLFKDDVASTLFKSEGATTLEAEILQKILSANHIAKNMTPPVVRISNNIDEYPMRLEFDKDSFQMHYRCGESELVFVDGLLTDILPIKNQNTTTH